MLSRWPFLTGLSGRYFPDRLINAAAERQGGPLTRPHRAPRAGRPGGLNVRSAKRCRRGGQRVEPGEFSLLAGNGYTREYPVERCHRNARIFTIFEDRSQIQRMIVGRAVTGLDVR